MTSQERSLLFNRQMRRMSVTLWSGAQDRITLIVENEAAALCVESGKSWDSLPDKVKENFRQKARDNAAAFQHAR